MTSYQYGSNNPSSKVDLDGLEGVFFFDETGLEFDPVENLSRAGGEFEGRSIPETGESGASATPKIELHHLIPQALKMMETIKQAIKEGFGFDDEENLSPQEKFNKSTGKGVHGNHPKYTEAIKGQIQDAVKANPGSTAAEVARAVANNARQTIGNNPGIKINDLFNINLLFQPKPNPTPIVVIGPLSPGTVLPDPKPTPPVPKPSPPPAPTPPPPPPSPIPPNMAGNADYQN